jgi:hypothetical protein
MSRPVPGDYGRLRRGSIWTKLNEGSTPHDTPGLAIPSIMRGFNLGGQRDSSLYRQEKVRQNA